MEGFIPVESARSIILDAVNLQGTKVVNLADALGYTLATDVVSKDQIPPFANSAMDGYAVRVEDFEHMPATLRMKGIIPAGAVPDAAVEPGTCIKIMTGAPFPEGGNAVAPIEWVEKVDDGQVTFVRAPSRGQHVRPAGQDVAVGERVFEAGDLITPPVIGMLATLGFGEVAVRVAPVAAVIATGDELVGPGEALTPGKIRNSSGSALCAQVTNAGGGVLPPLLARDNRQSIEQVIEKALEADFLIFAGGVSVGDYDLVKEVLDEFGMEIYFWKVQQSPGKPLAFGKLRGKPVFGLPGNPVSSAICFDQYVRPAIGKMLGHKNLLRPRHPAYLADATAKVKGLHFFARGIADYDADGRLRVRDTGPQASNLYSSMVKANCLFHIPAELEAAPAGTAVELEWLTW